VRRVRGCARAVCRCARGVRGCARRVRRCARARSGVRVWARDLAVWARAGLGTGGQDADFGAHDFAMGGTWLGIKSRRAPRFWAISGILGEMAKKGPKSAQNGQNGQKPEFATFGPEKRAKNRVNRLGWSALMPETSRREASDRSIYGRPVMLRTLPSSILGI